MVKVWISDSEKDTAWTHMEHNLLLLWLYCPTQQSVHVTDFIYFPLLKPLQDEWCGYESWF